jgi:hypothetical protein
MIRLLEANMSYKNSKEKLIKVRNKVLQPETESFIEAKKGYIKIEHIQVSQMIRSIVHLMNIKNG